MNSFLSLSSDILQQIFMELQVRDLMRFLNTNTEIPNIFKNNDIWKTIFERDYPVLTPRLGYFATWLHFTKSIWTLSRNIVDIRSTANPRYVNINLVISDIANILLSMTCEIHISYETLYDQSKNISIILIAADPKKITEIISTNELERQSVDLMNDLIQDFKSLGISTWLYKLDK